MSTLSDPRSGNEIVANYFPLDVPIPIIRVFHESLTHPGTNKKIPKIFRLILSPGRDK